MTEAGARAVTPAQARRICSQLLLGLATADEIYARDPRISLLALRVAERQMAIAVADLVDVQRRAEEER